MLRKIVSFVLYIITMLRNAVSFVLYINALFQVCSGNLLLGGGLAVLAYFIHYDERAERTPNFDDAFRDEHGILHSERKL